MSIELKQAAQDAAEAIDWLLKNIRLDAPQLSGKAMGNAEKCASALRAALAPQPTTAIACGIPGMAKTTCPYCEQGFAFEHEQPATGEPVQTTPNFTQLMQILDGLNRCHSRDSKVEFLRIWIRDWTQHKVDKLTYQAPSVPDEKPLPDLMMASYHEAIGWNACRAAMLAAK
mgnify:CR=1 FL=1